MLAAPVLQRPTAPRLRRARRPRRLLGTLVVPTPRLASEPKYIPRVRRYLRSVGSPRFTSELGTGPRSLEGLDVDFVRVHGVARKDDGTPLFRLSDEEARRLLRRGRLLSRDAGLLVTALDALSRGARVVRLGTPESLSDGTATQIRPSARENGSTP